MKAILRKTLVIMLAAILFVSTTGFTIFSHICFMTSEKQVSTQQIESCCTKTSSEASKHISSDCCLANSEFVKLEFTGSTRNTQDISDVVFILIDFSQTEEIYSPHLFAKTQNLLPPKKAGKILSLNQVFRI